MKIAFIVLGVLLCASVAFYLVFGYLLFPARTLRVFTYRDDPFRDVIIAEVERTFHQSYSEPLFVLRTDFGPAATTDDVDFSTVKPGRPILILITPGCKQLPAGLDIVIAVCADPSSEIVQRNLACAATVSYSDAPNWLPSALERYLPTERGRISGSKEYPELCAQYNPEARSTYLQEHPIPPKNGERVMLIPCDGLPLTEFSRLAEAARRSSIALVVDRQGYRAPCVIGTMSPDASAIGGQLASFILSFRSNRPLKGQVIGMSLQDIAFDRVESSLLNIPVDFSPPSLSAVPGSR